MRRAIKIPFMTRSEREGMRKEGKGDENGKWGRKKGRKRKRKSPFDWYSDRVIAVSSVSIPSPPLLIRCSVYLRRAFFQLCGILCMWLKLTTGSLSEIRAKLRQSAVWHVAAGCFFWAASHLNHSETLYGLWEIYGDRFQTLLVIYCAHILCYETSVLEPCAKILFYNFTYILLTPFYNG